MLPVSGMVYLPFKGLGSGGKVRVTIRSGTHKLEDSLVGGTRELLFYIIFIAILPGKTLIRKNISNG